MSKIELGMKVRDTITKFEGTAVSKHEYLYGCVRIGVQSDKMKDGKPVEAQCFDEPQLEILPKKQLKQKQQPGGSGFVPASRSTGGK